MKTKLVLSIIAILVCSVLADSGLSPETDNALDVGLREIDSLHFKNVKQSEIIKSDHPHAHMDVIELGEYYNYGTETHTILTEDGYILEMHRFTGNQKNPSPKGKQPVLLVHAFMCSSMTWVIAGPEKGLAFILADLGYDVWMGNVRGNKYSRRHSNVSIPDSEYWNNSFHEIGKYDLPAMIDHVVKKSGFEKIFYIGHSQGNAAIWVTLSERPEYNDKIKMIFALAPIAYISHATSPVFRALTLLNPSADKIMRLLGQYEIKPGGEFFRKFTSVICDGSFPTQPICTNVMFMISGYSKEMLDEKLLPAILAHIPAGSSTKQLLHFSQLGKSGAFRQFDYGWWKNIDVYKTASPPSYNFDNIKVPVSLHYSSGDWLSDPVDVGKLHAKLPNVIGKFRVPHKKFNHLDFVWGLNVKTLLYDKITTLMKRQEKLEGKQ